MGECSPHNDVNARDAFIGMCSGTTKKQMTLAVLEDVMFALWRQCEEPLRRKIVVRLYLAEILLDIYLLKQID